MSPISDSPRRNNKIQDFQFLNILKQRAEENLTDQNLQKLWENVEKLELR